MYQFISLILGKFATLIGNLINTPVLWDADNNIYISVRAFIIFSFLCSLSYVFLKMIVSSPVHFRGKRND